MFIGRSFTASFYAQGLVEEFGAVARRSASLEQLGGVFDDFVRSLSFRFHALVHHGDPRASGARRLRLDSYPSHWVDYFIKNGLHRDDPVQQACLRTGIGFAWTEVRDFVPVSRSQILILENSIRAGLGSGYTVPLPMTGEPPASCSFVTRPGVPFPVRERDAAQLGARLAFELALRLLRSGAAARGPRLTQRQRDCVALVAQGKTDWEIGTVLGISEETATKYVNAARRRYGVARRHQLPLAAYIDGEIDLSDIGILH